jgi:Aspartyl/Asparaginyl beta-hydroxylase
MSYHHVPDIQFSADILVAEYNALEYLRVAKPGSKGDNYKYAGIGLQGVNDRDFKSIHDAGNLSSDLQAFKPDFDEHVAKMEREITIPTQACVGEFKRILDHFIDRSYEPYRARIAILAPGIKIKWHVDTPTEAWRFHVPLTTNSKCWFDFDDGKCLQRLHYAVGVPHFVRVDIRHRFVNSGLTERAHLIIDFPVSKNDLIRQYPS